MSEIILTEEQDVIFCWQFQIDNQLDSIPEQLYHYRSGRSVKSILSENDVILRMTNYECFEDKTEGKIVNDYYEEALNSLLLERKISKNQLDRFQHISAPNYAMFLRKTSDKVISTTTDLFDAYIVCFCTEKDDPYMYDKYIHGKESGGFCMEFSGVALKSLREKSVEDSFIIKLLPVIYGNQAIDYIKEQIMIIIENNSLTLDGQQILIRELLHTVQLITKDEKYSEENEVRLIRYQIHESKPLEYKKYVEYKIPKDTYVNITSNPQNDSYSTENVKYVISQKGYRQYIE